MRGGVDLRGPILTADANALSLSESKYCHPMTWSRDADALAVIRAPQRRISESTTPSGRFAERAEADDRGIERTLAERSWMVALRHSRRFRLGRRVDAVPCWEGES